MTAYSIRLPSAALALLLAGCACRPHPGGRDGDAGAFPVDAGGRPVAALEPGSSLLVGARGLRPSTMYEFRLAVDDRPAPDLQHAVSFARAMSDARGEVPPLVLWYQSGVVGCSDRPADAPDPRRLRFRTFEEAKEALRGRRLTVSAHPVQSDPSGRTPPMRLAVGRAESSFELPIVDRRSPLVFASTREGCLLNSQEAATGDMFVSGRNFTPGETVEVSVVPNQRQWSVGDAIVDVTGDHAAEAPERVVVDAGGRFTVRAWERPRQQRGSFDIVVRHVGDEAAARRIGARDIVSYGAETGFILFLRYPVGGPTMDLAGRPVPGSPYFEFADSFAYTADPVWGAVDPTYVPIGHPGGTYAAYYVVNHRDVAGWTPAMGGSTALADVSGGIEVHPVKSGCVNGTDVIIWNPPLAVGRYDVVVDYGAVPAATAGAYATDGTYDAAVDFLDGADQVGFEVARDPYELGPFAIGADGYSQDDFFPTLGGASAVDLRAVVRYPATSAGTGVPVAAGKHPLFVIEHGNHAFCRVAATSHATCPVADRVRNHEGYMRLLDILASHGVIAVSIDAYDLTGPVPQWIPERGQLILKHLELWSHMNDATTFTGYPDFYAGRFAGHVDLASIAVSGHSRGGEASVAAWMLNANPAFTIRAVSSIAPVDGQAYVLGDVPYFVILPAADGDVSDLSGARIYDRAGGALTPPDGTTKSGIDVYGANHNFFNTVWAADWDDSVWPRPEGIVAAAQQKIGEAYLAAFNRVHLLGETVYDDMLRGRLTFPSTAGFHIYPMRHEKSHTRLMNGGLAGWTGGGGVALASVTNPAPHQTTAARVGWSSSAATWSDAVPAAQRDGSGFEVLALRAAQTTSAANPVTGNQDFILELTGGGKTKGVAVSRFDDLPRPYPHPYGFSHTVLTAVRVPLHSFIMNNAGVSLSSVDTVQLRFQTPATGEVYVDDIEFSR